MDPNYADYSYDDTYSLSPRRSRAGSRVSSTDGLFQNLHITDSPQSSTLDAGRPSSSSVEAAPSPAYLSPVPSHTEPYISSSSIAEHYQLPAFHQNSIAADWVEGQSQVDGPPLLRVDSAPGYSENPSTNTEGTMSAAAIGFDPTSFTMSNRSSFTWPSEPVPNQSLLSPGYSYGAPSDPTLTPPSTSRSLTSSPPRAPLSPDGQRDPRRPGNRQHAHQRRQMRTHQRVQRSGGSPYSQPAPIPDASEPHLPVYTAAATTMSMLASQPGAMAPQYAYSDASQQSLYSYGAAPVNSPGYNMPSATQSYYAAYQQQPPVTSQYGASTSSLSYAGLPQIMSPPVAERVVTPRPKPQCWDHGCNGRQFSTFSNLLRHQREKSGQATKSSCPNCGAEFTRTTARNGHLAHDKCKQRRTSSVGGGSNTTSPGGGA